MKRFSPALVSPFLLIPLILAACGGSGDGSPSGPPRIIAIMPPQPSYLAGQTIGIKTESDCSDCTVLFEDKEVSLSGYYTLTLPADEGTPKTEELETTVGPGVVLPDIVTGCPGNNKIDNGCVVFVRVVQKGLKSNQRAVLVVPTASEEAAAVATPPPPLPGTPVVPPLAPATPESAEKTSPPSATEQEKKTGPEEDKGLPQAKEDEEAPDEKTPAKQPKRPVSLKPGGKTGPVTDDRPAPPTGDRRPTGDITGTTGDRGGSGGVTTPEGETTATSERDCPEKETWSEKFATCIPVTDKPPGSTPGGTDEKEISKTLAPKETNGSKTPPSVTKEDEEPVCTGEGVILDRRIGKCGCDLANHFYRSPFVENVFGVPPLKCGKKIRELKLGIQVAKPSGAGSTQANKVIFTVSADDIFDSIHSIGDRQWLLSVNELSPGEFRSFTFNARPAPPEYREDEIVDPLYYGHLSEAEWALYEGYLTQGAPLLFPDGIRYFLLEPKSFPIGNQPNDHMTDDLFVAGIFLEACLEGETTCRRFYTGPCVNRQIKCNASRDCNGTNRWFSPHSIHDQSWCFYQKTPGGSAGTSSKIGVKIRYREGSIATETTRSWTNWYRGAFAPSPPGFFDNDVYQVLLDYPNYSDFAASSKTSYGFTIYDSKTSAMQGLEEMALELFIEGNDGWRPEIVKAYSFSPANPTQTCLYDQRGDIRLGNENDTEGFRSQSVLLGPSTPSSECQELGDIRFENRTDGKYCAGYFGSTLFPIGCLE